MRKAIIIGAVMIFCACKTASYKVHIATASYDFKTNSETGTKIKDIEATTDSLAFEESVNDYWSSKLIAEHMIHFKNARLPTPYYFVLYRYWGNDSTVVDFDSATTEKIARPIINKLKIKLSESSLFWKEVDSLDHVSVQIYN